MSLILTPPPTVMVFFKEISLKNESTVGDPLFLFHKIVLLGILIEFFLNRQSNSIYQEKCFLK